MSLQRFSWTEPALCHYDHDLKKSWFVYFDYTDNLTRKTKRLQFRGGINRIKERKERLKQGNALVAFWKDELRRGYNPFSEDEGVMKMPYHYTVAEAFDRILQIKLPTLRKRAKETYSYMVRFFKNWLALKNMDLLPMADFQKTMAQEYMDYLIEVRNYAGRTHNDHLIVLKTFCNEMVEREWISKNPFRKISMKETEVGRNVAFSDEEVERLRKMLYLQDRRLYYFTQIMYYCFIRRSELARLRVHDVDLKNYAITIPADVSKNKAQESVVIPVGLEPILKEMNLSQYNGDEYLFGRHLLTSYTMFTNINHISTRHTNWAKDKAIGAEKGLYSWKHTGVCKAYYATGKDIYSLMRQLRHRDLNTTQIYLKSLGLVNNDVFRNAMTA